MLSWVSQNKVEEVEEGEEGDAKKRFGWRPHVLLELKGRLQLNWSKIKLFDNWTDQNFNYSTIELIEN